ncbi:MAG: right-handed parallel beta-helix repeat-containing protein [Candidatus Bathyarchaeia archaeon]|jgi:parallel beta-helix repeat protein
MSRSKWAILLTFVLSIASGAVLVEYFTHYVMPMSIVVPDDYPTIQAAIGNATPGSTIHVRNGNYNELLLIDKPLNLTGENAENTAIKGLSGQGSSFRTIAIQSSNVLISNCKITGSSYGIALTDNCTNCKITNNNIQGYTTSVAINGENNVVTKNSISESWLTGISCYGNNCLISDNTIENCESGIIVNGNNVTIENNIIINGKIDTADYYCGGVVLSSGGSCKVYGNTLQNLKTGILYKGASHSQVYNNNITQNQVGVDLSNYQFFETSGGTDNIVFNNNVIDNQKQVIVETTTPGKFTSNGTDTISWDNGIVGNYWSDFQDRYPNATQNNNTDTYNTPYIIDTKNRDNHPVIKAIKT